ncbi:MAG TPA: hypothetical protein VJ793_11015 [Anaerolineae bacterium]|nr:hypothetical protein [Anaerolineae bacterium]
MPLRKSETIWIVVFVQSGVIIDVRAYRNERTAKRQLQIWRNEMDLNDDDVQIFEAKV